MTYSWAAVLPTRPGDPVRADDGVFRDAASSWRRAEREARQLSSEFGQFARGADCLGFTGEAANAFKALVAEVEKPLRDYPVVCESITDVLDSHARSLTALRAEAQRALNRAAVAWESQRSARQNEDRQRTALRQLDSQIEQLRRSPDPEVVAFDLNARVQQRSTVSGQLASTQRSLAGATASLKQAECDWDELRSLEDQLNQSTKSALSSIDLLSLRDPGRLKAMWDSAGDILSGLREWAKDALWRLRDALDVIIAVVAIILIVVVVVALVVAGGPAGLVASIAALKLTMGFILTGLTGLRFLTDLVLYETQAPHPDTGRTMDLGTVVVSGLSFALSFLAFGSEVLTSIGQTGKGFMSVAVRPAIAHLADFGGATLEVFGQVFDSHSGLRQLGAGPSALAGGLTVGIIAGVPAGVAASALIYRQITASQSAVPRLSSPVVPVVCAAR